MKNDSLNRVFRSFFKGLNDIQPEYSGADEVWVVTFQDSKKSQLWNFVRVVRYQDSAYLTANRETSLEFDLRKGKFAGEPQAFTQEGLIRLLKQANDQLKKIKKDWLGYYKNFFRRYPFSQRYGFIRRRLLWQLGPDWYRPDKKIKQLSELISLLARKDYAREEDHLPSMTLELYLKYCRIAYLANIGEYKKCIHSKMTGLEMYKRMADGRSEGLLDIKPDSPEALEAWYHGGRGGGHPWEICRGGNSTHIDLGLIHEKKKGWAVFLNGKSTGRMLETARMALAFTKNKMPFVLQGAGEMRFKFLGEDNVGIVPEGDSLKYAERAFPEGLNVYDCIHYFDLGHFKGKSRKFIVWLPEKPVVPKRALKL